MIGRIMNRKVTNRFFAGLCISLGLMACTQEIEQEKYHELVVGLEDDRISLYPLGDTVQFSVYPAGLWEIDFYKQPSGILIKKEDAAVKLVAEKNDDKLRSGSIDLTYMDDQRTIEVIQDKVLFEISKNGNVIRNGATFEIQGGKIPFEISSNVNFRLNSMHSDFKIADTTQTSFIVDASSSPAKNGEDISGSIYVDLYDKDGKYREVQNHYVFTLLHKAFLFKWTDENSDSRSCEVKFNDKKPQKFSFISSGKWHIQKDAEWIDLKNDEGNSISEGEPGEYTLCLSANEVNTDSKNPRRAAISIIADEYPDNPLVVNFTQKEFPEGRLVERGVIEIREEGIKPLKVDVRNADEFKANWKIIEGNDFITLESTEGSSNIVTAKKEGLAKILVSIEVDDYPVGKDSCEVKVIREYAGDGTGEEIGNDNGEW